MKKYSSILFIILLTGCNFNTVYKNREQDKQDAEKITQKFYSIIKKGNTKEVLPLFSQDFFKVTNKDKFLELFEKTNNVYGKILNDSLVHWETLVIKGNNPKSEYLLVYYAKRENIDSQEYITLHNEKKGIKIFEYRINVDTLSKKK
ncbi:hypothetical protein [Epilithonimonas caeni]|uniref:hypothetical protein n=1 Tax=Epilithonimonas caeni TaxID=365343 RepID=UPI000489FAC2|nr:hypothetical protein [Epilithonimonas caeni]